MRLRLPWKTRKNLKAEIRLWEESARAEENRADRFRKLYERKTRTADRIHDELVRVERDAEAAALMLADRLDREVRFLRGESTDLSQPPITCADAVVFPRP